jgi:PEGA domain
MRRKIRFSLLTALILVALALAPRTAQAQWHGHGPHGGTHVVVGFGFGWGYPYWGWGYPYWGWGWGYPYWGWGPYWSPPSPPDASAELKLEIKPKDAQVYVDGYYAGVVDDFDGSFQRLHIPPGSHELVLYKAGFRTIKQTIRVRVGQNSKVQYAMPQLPAGETAEPPPEPPPQSAQDEPQQTPPPRGYVRTPPPSYAPPPQRMPPSQPQAPAPAENRGFGTLLCRVQPSGAEILIDGERWQGPEGDVRLVVQLAEGPHHVEIRKEGFVTFTSEITVHRDETTPLNVSLPPRGE